MTRKNLEKLYSLNREIAICRKRLKEFEGFCRNPGVTITGLPYLNDFSDREVIIEEITRLRDTIDKKIRQSIAYYQELMEYIEEIDDPFVRQIVALRCLNCLTWVRIAHCVGGANTRDSVRQVYYRYFKKTEELMLKKSG